MGLGVGGDRQVEGREGWPKFEKGVVGNIEGRGGDLHKIGGLAALCQLGI